MQNKVTKCTPPYPVGYEPDLIIPATYCEYRYALGKCGTNPFDEKIMYENLEVIKTFLLKNKISEVWGAWGDDKKIKALQKGKDGILSMLANIKVKVFYYGTLTKAKNPRLFE